MDDESNFAKHKKLFLGRLKKKKKSIFKME
jgi:hypothetical protein